MNCHLSDEQETLAELRELNAALWIASAEVVRLQMRTKVLQQHLRDLRGHPE
jgi:hypothetical protein